MEPRREDRVEVDAPDGRRPPVGPRGLRLVLGVLAVALGAFLAVRPFSSLAVLVVLVVAGLVVAGLGELPDRSRWGAVRGAACLAAALAVLVWPGITIRVLTLVVAAALLVGGGTDLAQARTLRGAARLAAAVDGASSVALGLLALAWPDVTVLVVAVVFGVRVVMVGVRTVVAALRGRAPAPGPPRVGGRARRGGRWRAAGTVVGALVAVALVATSVVLQRGVPVPDAFYDPPADAPSAPGRLLRNEPFRSAEIPPGASAWRILYTTTRDEGRPAVASGLVVVPTGARSPSPVVAWAHGTTGAAPGCAPTVLTDGLGAGAMFVQDDVLAQGWAMVATDYPGLGTAGPHPYLIGQGEGRSVLDAVRAAHELEVGLADRTVVWGHSQGGHAALWTGVLASTYAPELDIAGVAALAPASNLPDLVDSLGDVTGGALFASYVVDEYAHEYPDVTYERLVRPGARILVREMAQRCLAEPGVLVSALTSVVLDKPVWHGDPSSGAFLERLVENVPSGPVAAPLLVAQGADDPLVVPAAQDAYVGARCAAGYPVDYRTYAGRDHVGLVEADSPLVPELVAWTADRFDGAPATDTCG